LHAVPALNRANRLEATLTDQGNIQTAKENVAAFSAKDWTRFKATLSQPAVV
jgi:hypothetical protein